MKFIVSYTKKDAYSYRVDTMCVEATSMDKALAYIKREERYIEEYHIKPLDNLLADCVTIESGHSPAVIAISKLANVEIAAEDYNIGGKEVDGKHYFTFDEALEVQKKLKNTGWRLPTRSEWALICEEFGQGEDGNLDEKELYKNLNMGPTGWLNENGHLHVRPTGGVWWSGTAGSATSGRYLDTGTGGVYAQGTRFRGYGYALRLVRDVKKAGESK